MKPERLIEGKITDFVAYCKKHKLEIDDSFLYDEDLREFESNEENPTYIVRNIQGEITAVASLMIDDYAKRGKKARFRIFHSEIEDKDCYELLMKAILVHTEGLDNIYIFVPTENKVLEGFIKELNFTIERYAFLLIREDLEVPEYNLPNDYQMMPFRPGIDEETWCDIRNTSFITLKGSETPMTPEMVKKMIEAEEYIDGGAIILFHMNRPVGVIKGSVDEYEGHPIMDIGPIAIIPEYQGKGLGRSMLRKILLVAKEKSYKRTVLSVNAENKRAKELYIQEGFKQVEAVACYKYDLI